MKVFDLKCVVRVVASFYIFGLLASINPSLAQSEIKLGLPIDWSIGNDCWLVTLVDLDASNGVQDYKYQSDSYDGHKGTDI
ncbi:MAG: hypothetical protein ACI85H_000495 [Paracoccaceae bacterium]|jgi:hypothetical protein